jgi:hypothetical protein
MGIVCINCFFTFVCITCPVSGIATADTIPFPVFGDTITDDSEAEKVLKVFLSIGSVTVKKLQSQPDLTPGVGVIDMPCCYGVFPVHSSELNIETMSVFVDKNFDDIFKFVTANSGWNTNCTKAGILVDGPPGSGKEIDCYLHDFPSFLCVATTL